jgi:serine phosphatase RsbU (regulator of sigma subunit)
LAELEAALDQQPVHEMQCMEIWGGIEAAKDRVSTPGLDAWVFAKPHRSAEGGDIHYLSMCGAGAISRVLLADVSGHGAEVAEVAKNLRRLLRKHMNTFDSSRLAQALNEQFKELAEYGTFATALLATYFAPTDQLLICNAGHPRPLWYSNEHSQWQSLAEQLSEGRGMSNLPLGVVDGTDYRQFIVALAPGDWLVLYSDALIEARDGRGRQLGEQGLLELASTVELDSPEEAGLRLLEAVGAFRGNHPPDDDLTLLVLYHNAGDPPPQPLSKKLRSMAKMIGLLPV